MGNYLTERISMWLLYIFGVPSCSQFRTKENTTSRAQDNAQRASSLQLMLITESIYGKLTHKSQKNNIKELKKLEKYRTVLYTYTCSEDVYNILSAA